MVIQIECGSRNRYSDIIQALEEMPENKVTYLGQDKINPIAMLFEVDSDDFDTISRKVEKAIKSTRYGRMISFRVVPQGALVYYKK
ncbi:MAG: hypothetical protein ACI4U3_04680 [Traorella sp.]